MDAIHLPNAISLPTTLGAPVAALQPGQIVQALVLELVESDVFRLQLPQAIVDVRSNVSLNPGSTVTLAVNTSGANARLTIYADGTPQPLAGQQQPGAQQLLGMQAGATAALAGRRPIGEAVIVARVPLTPEAQPPPQTQVTPERALVEAVSAAASRQGGLAPLLADIEQIALAAPGLVPAPVRAAASQVAALRVPLETITAADVKQAFLRSGVLFEPRLDAKAMEIAAEIAPSSARAATPLPAGDLKAALLVFREVLKVWAHDTAPLQTAPPTAPAGPPQPVVARPALPLSDLASMKHLVHVAVGALQDTLPALLATSPPLSPEQATSLSKDVATQLMARDTTDHSAPAGPNGGPPPPYRGAALSAQQPVAATIAPGMPVHESAERLLTETDGAIARITMLQAASMPDQPSHRDDPGARWTFEVPFMMPQGSAIAQFEVSRDGHAAAPGAPASVWRARFSLDVEPMGPVHALVAIAGERASVTLWAERASTVTRLNEQAAMLGEALRAVELEPADVQFRLGTPPAAKHAATPGRFMDRAS